MKKKYLISGVILIFVVILGFAFVQGQQKQKPQAKPTVGILQLMSHPALDAIHKGIIHGLEEEATSLARTLRLISKTLKMIKVT